MFPPRACALKTTTMHTQLLRGKFLLICLSLFSITIPAFAQTVDGCAGTGGSQVICGASGPIAIADMITGESQGGSWWMTAYGSGGAFDAELGIFTPDAQTQGIFMFSYYFSEDPTCGNATSTVTLTFVTGDASDDRAGHSCQGDSAMFNLNEEILLTVAGQQGGGTWTRTAGTGGIFDAAAGTFDCTGEATSSTFVYTTQGGCGMFTCTFNVYRAQRPVPGAGADGEMTVCAGTTGTYNLHDIISGEQMDNPLWTRISGTGGTLDPLTGIFTIDAGTTTSVFRYRMAVGAGMCGNDSSFATITVGDCSAADQGCAAAYWKENPSQWCTAYSPATNVSAIFNVPQPLKNKNLMQVLSLKGNGPQNLARQAVTALLNICSEEVDYPLPYGHSVQSLVTAVNQAFASNGNTVNSLASSLEELNQSECPMNDGRASAINVLASPNPFKDKINISFTDSYQGSVKIQVYDVLGRLMSEKTGEVSPQGLYEFQSGFTPVTGQLYFIRITTASGTSIIKSMGE